MAFQLTHSRPLSSQYRRLVRKELESAANQLQPARPTQVGIHEARKSLKKVRALLRLLRPELGSRYDRENARLRTAAHALSSLRDADATLDTVKTLHGRYPAAVTPAVVRAVRAGLRARKRDARRKARRRIRRAAGTLKRAGQALPRRLGRISGFEPLRAGSVEAYRAARRSMSGLTLDAEATRFHEWRKRVKDFWYDLRLFEGLHRAPRGRVRTVGRLEELLGDAHDLTMLHDLLLDGSDRYGDARTQALLLGAISKGETSLRRRALQLGHRTLSQRPRDFEKSLRTWWRNR